MLNEKKTGALEHQMASSNQEDLSLAHFGWELVPGVVHGAQQLYLTIPEGVTSVWISYEDQLIELELNTLKLTVRADLSPKE